MDLACKTGDRDEWLALLVVFLIVGYLTMSRTFAHLGLAPLYVGELSLLAIALSKPGVLTETWGRAGLRSGPASSLATAYYVFLTYGVLQTVRGILLGHNARVAVENLVFQVYPVFFFVGLWVGRRHPDTLRKWMLPFAWIQGLYGLVYVVILIPSGLVDQNDMPTDGAVAWFGQPYGPAVAVLALMSFYPQFRTTAIPLILNVCAFLALEVRAAWVSFSLILPLWGWLSGNLGRIAKVAVVLGLLLLAGFVADVRVPAIGTRTSETGASVRASTSRVVALIDRDLAERISPSAASAAGTISWRQDWWSAILSRVNATPTTALVGPGYGYPIWNLHPMHLREQVLRTPHNAYVYAIGYTGWLGLLLFLAFQATLGALLWRAYRISGQPFGVCYWLMIVIWAAFDNFLEAPYGAIPFYLLTGLAASPALEAGRRDEAADDSHTKTNPGIVS
ncbi:MAG: O-antigen ligase family protein [Thermoguttaceae bacterium]